mmetsp:Transcript_10830/g.16323  ORF Transcript_10830/g.16323 Transcript_10830/m.16323 type:complete len:292 (+) Transcript_10830:1005-1880(+)
MFSLVKEKLFSFFSDQNIPRINRSSSAHQNRQNIISNKHMVLLLSSQFLNNRIIASCDIEERSVNLFKRLLVSDTNTIVSLVEVPQRTAKSHILWGSDQQLGFLQFIEFKVINQLPITTNINGGVTDRFVFVLMSPSAIESVSLTLLEFLFSNTTLLLFVLVLLFFFVSSSTHLLLLTNLVQPPVASVFLLRFSLVNKLEIIIIVMSEVEGLINRALRRLILLAITLVVAVHGRSSPIANSSQLLSLVVRSVRDSPELVSTSGWAPTIWMVVDLRNNKSSRIGRFFPHNSL